MSISGEKHLENLKEFSSRLYSEILKLMHGEKVVGGCQGKDISEKIKNTSELKRVIDQEIKDFQTEGETEWVR